MYIYIYIYIIYIYVYPFAKKKLNILRTSHSLLPPFFPGSTGVNLRYSMGFAENGELRSISPRCQ